MLFGVTPEEPAAQDGDQVFRNKLCDPFWACREGRGQGTGSSHYYSRAKDYCTFVRNINFVFSHSKSRLPNITCGVGNFVKIWSACRQHEIQYTQQGMDKYMCNTNILIRTGKTNKKRNSQRS
jgi:hypothetical protein